MTAMYSLISQYAILEYLSEYMSTLDLFHLALTCSEYYRVIRTPDEIFHRLKRLALCDGRGLIERQEFKRLHAPSGSDHWSGNRTAVYDEELEVQVWNRKCDAANALPCLRCQVNVCEECRFVPRVRDTPHYGSRRRPHLESSYSSHHVVCYCTACDISVERDLPLRLSEYCDCDQYTRWICAPCKVKEDGPLGHYVRTRTRLEWNWEDPHCDLSEGLWLQDHQEVRAFWCLCGNRAPKGGNVRCAWCMRRHNATTWLDENPDDIPFFDNDNLTAARSYLYEVQWRTLVQYPSLGYTGARAP